MSYGAYGLGNRYNFQDMRTEPGSVTPQNSYIYNNPTPQGWSPITGYDPSYVSYMINTGLANSSWDSVRNLPANYTPDLMGDPNAAATGGSATGDGFTLGGNAISPADAARLANDPTAMLSNLLSGTTGLNPASLSYYSPAFDSFQNIYMMNNDFEFTQELADAVASGDPEKIAIALGNIPGLQGQSVFDAAEEYQRLQSTPGSGGVDPVRQFAQFLASSQIPANGTPTGYGTFANAGSMSDQVNFFRQGVNDALVNANPYMRDLVSALIGWLGLQYLASGDGQGAGGFANYIARRGQGSPTTSIPEPVVTGG